MAKNVKTWFSPCMSAFRSTRPEANSAFISDANISQSRTVVLHDGVEQRADPGAVAGEQYLVRAAIPHADGDTGP